MLVARRLRRRCSTAALSPDGRSPSGTAVIAEIGEQQQQRAVAERPVRRAAPPARAAGTRRPAPMPARRGTIASRRTPAAGGSARARSGAARARARTSRGGTPQSCSRRSRRECGPAPPPRRIRRNCANSRWRPSRTASASSGSKSQKNRNGRARRPFLAHEQQRDLRRQQHDRDRRMDQRLGRVGGDALAERRVADLVVVLQERDKGGRRQIARRLAARLRRRDRARARPDRQSRSASARPSMRDRLARHSRRNSRRSARSPAHAARDADRRSTAPCSRPAARRCRRRRRASFASFSSTRWTGRSAIRRRTVCASLGQDVGLAVVDDRVHRVEAQPVEMELLEPVERVVRS